MEGRFDWGRYDFGTFRRRDVLTMGRFDCKALYAKPSHFRRNFRPTRNDEDVGLYLKLLRVSLHERSLFCDPRQRRYDRKFKPTSSKLFHTQTSIQRVSLLFVSINLPLYQTPTLKICFA